jgi:hypothetical protein
MFDGEPANLDEETGAIYAIEGGDLHVITLSREDVEWASQWRWKIKRSKNGKKLYPCRSQRVTSERWTTVWLHKEICFRAHGRPPSKLHIIADHCDSETFNCQRPNMRWATPKMNRQNYHGIYAQQLRMAFLTDDDTRLTRYSRA